MSKYKSSDLKGAVLTVKGPIDPLQLGKTICHEHLFIDFRLVYKDPPLKKDIEKTSEKVQLNKLLIKFEESRERKKKLEDKFFEIYGKHVDIKSVKYINGDTRDHSLNILDF